MSKFSTGTRFMTAAAVLTSVLCGPALSAREPGDYGALKREMAIMEDVFQSALRATVDDRVRISGLEIDYLANQGVVIALDASRSLLSPSMDLDEYEGLEVLSRIPTMVEEILQDVEIYVAPYDPEELHELRALREDQRRLRTEQRSVRSKLRDLRRRKARADDSEARDLEDRIEQFENELAALDDEYEALDDDIDDAYERMRDLRSRHQDRVVSEETQSLDVLEDALIGAVCDYGPTVKSLPDDEHLTVVVRQRRGNTYYVFNKRDVWNCQRESMTRAELKEASYIY